MRKMKTLLKILTAISFTIFSLFAIAGLIQDSKSTDISFMQLDQINNNDLEVIRTRYVAADASVQSEGLIDNVRPVKVKMDGNEKRVNGNWRIVEKVLTDGNREKSNDIVELEFLEDGIVKLVFKGEVEGEKWFIGEELAEGNTLKLITNIHNNFITEKQEQDFFNFGSPSNEILTLFLEKVKIKKEIRRAKIAPVVGSDKEEMSSEDKKPVGFQHLKNGVYLLEKVEINNVDVTDKYEMDGSIELVGREIKSYELSSNDLLDEEIVDSLKFHGGVIVGGGRIDRIEQMVIATTDKKKIVLRYPQAVGEGFQFAYLTFSVEEAEEEGEIDDEYEKLLATDTLNGAIENTDSDLDNEYPEDDYSESIDGDSEEFESDEMLSDGPMTEQEQDYEMGRRTVQPFDFANPN